MSAVSFVPSKRGGKLLVHEQYLYRIARNFKGKSYWRCATEDACRGAISLSEDNVIIKCTGYHQHQPEEDKIERKKLLSNLKTKTKSKVTVPVPKIHRKRDLIEEEIMRNRSDLLSLNGRRIVDINFFIKGILDLSDHGKVSCSFKNMMLISEIRKGFQSGFEFKCRRCSMTKTLWTESNSVPINSAAVEGMAAIGRGFSSLERFSNALNIPCDISIYEYATDQTTVTEVVEAAEEKKRLEEAEQEKRRLKKAEDRKKRREEEAAERKKRLEEATEEEKQVIIAEEQKKKTALDKCYVYVDWTKISQGKDSQSPEANIKKQPEAVIGSEPDSVLGLEPKILSVTPAAELDSTMLITPDINPPDLSAPGPSKRMEPDSSMSEQDVHRAMTCEVYPADAPPQTVFPIKVKEEPLEPDAYKQDILSATVVKELNSVSKDSSVTSSQVGSLFQPPVLIKEEPVSSEDEL